MKRAGHLIEQVADITNLELAWHKAQRGKASKPEVSAFGSQLGCNLRRLQAQILSGEVDIGGYHYFTVYDPKKRQICAAPFPQRVLHHALMNICHPFFERQQIFDSYASRKGKGTYAALERAGKFNSRHRWYLQLDVRKYFDSIHHGVVRSQLSRLFKDPLLLRIFDRIIDSYAVLPGRGLPIGNLTSQYFANHYLAPADHYAREFLCLPAYVRYMDDMVLWHDDKATLMEAGRRFNDFICERLLQELKPFCMNQNTKGLPFLGYLLYPGSLRLSQRSRRRYQVKIKGYNSLLQHGCWSEKKFQNHATPLTAFTLQADAKTFRQKVHASIGI